MQSDISMKFKFLQKKGKAVDNSVTSSVCSQWTISANKSTCHASRQSKFDLRSPQQKEKIKSPLISAYAPRHVHTLYLSPHMSQVHITCTRITLYHILIYSCILIHTLQSQTHVTCTHIIQIIIHMYIHAHTHSHKLIRTLHSHKHITHISHAHALTIHTY